MPTQNKYDELGSYAAKVIKRKAAEIVELEGFSASDLEDIEQDLALEVLRRTPDFDPARGSYEGFVGQVVNHAMTDMVDKRWAPMRNPRRCECSLNAIVPDGEGGLVERAETMDHEACLGSGGHLTGQDRADLRLDLEGVLESLAQRERRVCAMLAEGRGLPEIAELTGIPHRTVYRIRARIRERFGRAGLAGYLGRKRGRNSESSGT